MPPFKSEAQRRLMYAAKKSPSVRKRYGISRKAAAEMTAHDRKGKLRERARGHKGAYLSKYD